MIKIELSQTIDRAAEDIFNLFADLGSYHDWQPGVVEARQLSSGALRVGSEIAETRSLLGRKVESKLHITALERYRRFGFRHTAEMLAGETDITLKPVWGGTQVILTGNVEPAGLFKTLEPLFARAYLGQLRGALAKIDKGVARRNAAGGGSK